MTPQQARFAKLWEQGFTYPEIAAMMNERVNNLVYWRQRLRLPPRDKGKEAEERRRALAPALTEMAASGLTQSEMAERLGIHQDRVKELLGRLGIRRVQRTDGAEATARKCLRCGTQFLHLDPPKVKRLCHSCTGYASDNASALA